MGNLRAYQTASGATGYTITINQKILPDISEDRKRRILLQQDAVRAELASEHGVTALLASGGVR